MIDILTKAQMNDILTTTKTAVEIVFFAIASVVTVLTYHHARKTVLQPFRAEVFKEQLRLFAEILRRFSGRHEHELKNDIAWEQMVEANIENLLDLHRIRAPSSGRRGGCLEEGSVGTASLAIACLLTAACGSPSTTWAPERADLEVELVANVLLETVSLRVEDDRIGESLGERMFNLTALPAPRSGASGVSGDVQGYDEQGRVRTSYRLKAVVTVDDRPVPSSGACTPRS
jgi:hypothetical protein